MFYLVAVLGIAALIVIHEAGHFAVARLFGMRVTRFSVGFLKPLVEWKPKGSETTYAIGALPLGGYVQIDGLSPADEVDPEDRRSYANQPLYAKLLMVVAGPAANFLAAVAIFVALFLVGIPVQDDGPVLGAVNEGEPAHRAGLRAGDRILEIDREAVASWSDIAERIHRSPGKALVVAYERAGERRDVEVTPRASGEIGLIGISPSTHLERRGLAGAVTGAFLVSAVSTAGIAVLVTRLVTCRASPDSVASPVGIVRMSVDQLRAGFRYYLMMLAQLSLSLCLLNFLPLPALDGGRVTFMFAELVTRRRIDRNVEGYVHAVGFLLLMGLLLLIVFRDVRACF